MSRGLVIAGGPILTMADPLRAEAVAVVAGRVAHAGTLDDCRHAAGPGHAERDLGGRTLMPGFVDPHAHPLMLGQTRAWAHIGPDVAPTIDALVAILSAHAAALPPGVPVRGFGYDRRVFPDGRHPSSDDLDRVARDREVYAMNASGHGGVVNGWTLARNGITAATPDVPGGEIGRHPDGTPNGVLMDAACDLITGPDGVKIRNHGPNLHFPEPVDALGAHLAAAEDEFLRAGVTTVVDAQASRREIETFIAARDAGRLRLRVDLLVISALLDEVLALGLRGRLGDDDLAFAGIKLYADGSLAGSTAWFPEGYAADPNEHGLLYHDPAEFRELVGRAHAAGLQTGTHAQSPTAIGLTIDAIAEAQARTPRPDARHCIEHCGLPTDDQIEALARHGIIPVPQPQNGRTLGDTFIRLVGPELGGRYQPSGLFARAGIPVVLSSDAPVSPPRPLLAVQAAVERRTIAGTDLGGVALRVDVLTALHGVTSVAAWATRRERSVGSLEAGKLADFAILAADPTAVPVPSIGAIAVEETWRDGRRIA